MAPGETKRLVTDVQYPTFERGEVQVDGSNKKAVLVVQNGLVLFEKILTGT